MQPFVLGEGAGKTQQHGRRDPNGELPTHICRSVAVEVACPSGRCYYPRLGLAVLRACGSAFFLQSETVAIVTDTCWWDGGKTTLRGVRKRIVNLGCSAFVPSTLGRIIQTATVVRGRDIRPD